MNREKAVRKAFYNALNGSLVYNTVSLPVFDGKADNGLNLYVVIIGQSSDLDSDFRNNRWNHSITISITQKQDNSYTRDIVDDINELIEAILKPGEASVNGLPDLASYGWQYTNLAVKSVDYQDFKISETKTLCIKLITFDLKVLKL